MSAAQESRAYESQLPDGWQRFLAHVVEHAFAIERRQPEDFIRHFPPSAIMAGLEDEPQRRANILVICTGVRMKIAVKKSAKSCAQDLQIALDEEETDAETIVTLLDPDDRVLYLDAPKLWAYVTEGEFWSDAGSATAREHVAYMIGRALTDDLITHREIVEGIGTDTLAERLPREELGRLLAAALTESHSGAAFDEQKMLGIVPASTLVEFIPLPHIWDRVVGPLIAARHGLAEAPVEAAPAEAAPEVVVEPVAEAEPEPEARADGPAKGKGKGKGKSKPPPPEDDLDLAIDDVLGLDDDDTTAGKIPR
ncbi:MAG: hypothetical protein H6719_12400 [Sandaracinaceae bacterium]|nr:hypothetical protein [Sandaracinaceae bacterium]